jgi:putative Ca2+/H+ antiporter (TMEM165/GDT1 family)
MDLSAFFAIFVTIFLAELGDKTQLATMLYSSQGQHSKWLIFGSSALALIASSALGVLAGGLVGKFISPDVLRWIAGLGFIGVGAWTLWKGAS